MRCVVCIFKEFLVDFMPQEVVIESLANINVPVGLRQRKVYERTLKKNLTNRLIVPGDP